MPRDDDDDDFNRPARGSKSRSADNDDRNYEEPHRGTLILVLGIVGLVACPLTGVAAWLMGNADLHAMEEGRMDPAGREHTRVGKILGIVSTVLLLLQVFLYLFIFAIAIADS